MHTARALKRFLITYSISVISLIILTASVILALLPYVQRQSNAVCGCNQFDVIPSTPASWLLFGLLATSIVFGIVVVLKMVMMVWQTRQFHQTLMHHRTYTTIYRGVAIHTVDLAEPRAVCVGYFKPQVYISATVLKTLSGFELLAVIQHEAEHAKRFDPLQRLLLQALPQQLLKRYTAAQEIIADDVVTDVVAVQSAFVKMTDVAQPGTLAATWFSTSQARVNHWLGEHTPVPSFRFGVIGVIIFGGLLISSYQAFAAEPATQAFGQCLAVQTMCESVMSYVVQ